MDAEKNQRVIKDIFNTFFYEINMDHEAHKFELFLIEYIGIEEKDKILLNFNNCFPDISDDYLYSRLTNLSISDDYYFDRNPYAFISRAEENADYIISKDIRIGKNFKYFLIIKINASYAMNNYLKVLIEELIFGLYRNAFKDEVSYNYTIRKILYDTGHRYINFLIEKYADSGYECDFFIHFDKVSMLKYEGSDSNGTIMVANKSRNPFLTYNSEGIYAEYKAEIPFSLKFKTKISINQTKKLRKLLEISSDNLLLLSDGIYVYGMISKNGFSQKNYIILKFIGYHNWLIEEWSDDHLFNSIEILSGVPKITKAFKITEESFTKIFTSIFQNVNSVRDQWDFISLAIEQKHGSLLVFLEDAETESIKFLNLGFPVIPKKISKNAINITSIDGAVILDKYGNVHSIGVILDGVANSNSEVDISRGARYNSAIKYTSSIEQECLVLVISEDGYINFIHRGKEIKSNTV